MFWVLGVIHCNLDVLYSVVFIHKINLNFLNVILRVFSNMSIYSLDLHREQR